MGSVQLQHLQRFVDNCLFWYFFLSSVFHSFASLVRCWIDAIRKNFTVYFDKIYFQNQTAVAVKPHLNLSSSIASKFDGRSQFNEASEKEKRTTHIVSSQQSHSIYSTRTSMDQQWQPIARAEFSTTTVARIFFYFQSTSGAVDRCSLVYLRSFLNGSFLLKDIDFSAFPMKSHFEIQSCFSLRVSFDREVK